MNTLSGYHLKLFSHPPPSSTCKKYFKFLKYSSSHFDLKAFTSTIVPLLAPPSPPLAHFKSYFASSSRTKVYCQIQSATRLKITKIYDIFADVTVIKTFLCLGLPTVFRLQEKKWKTIFVSDEKTFQKHSAQKSDFSRLGDGCQVRQNEF